MKTVKQTGSRLFSLMNGGIVLNLMHIDSGEGSHNAVETMRQVAQEAVSKTSIAGNPGIANVLSGPAGWIVLILTTLALLAGFGIIYYLGHLRLHRKPPKYCDPRSKRVRLYNPSQPEDIMSPFSPRRGLG
jgi:hypothetical protein